MAKIIKHNTLIEIESYYYLVVAWCVKIYFKPHHCKCTRNDQQAPKAKT